ncbi:MAG: PAS domain-containing protein [Bacteroidota bacterium]
MSTSSFYDDSGLLIGAISNFIDITKKVETDFKMQERQKRCEKLIEEAPYTITIYNKEGLLIMANNKWEEYWRVPVSDCVGKLNLFKSEIFNQKKVKKFINDAFQGNEGDNNSYPFTSFERRRTHFRINYYSLFDKKGALDKVVCFIEDVTRDVFTGETKTAEKILDTIGDEIIVVDEEDRVLNINNENKRPFDRLLLATEIANLAVGEYDKDADKVYWENKIYEIFSDSQEPIPRSKIKDIIVGEDKNFLGGKIGI